MATVFVYIESAIDTPLTGASPTLDYWDKSSPGAPVATGVPMAEMVGGIGGGYFVDVATVDGREYFGKVDATTGARAGTRYPSVKFSGETDARVEIDIPAILAGVAAIFADTTAIDGRLPADPADESNQLAEHAVTQAAVAGVLSDTDDIQSRLPAALVGGRMDSDVANMQADVVDAGALATDAINEIRDSILSDSTAFDGADVAAILADTDAIDTRLPSDPADESLQQAAHAQTQLDISNLENLSAAQAEVACEQALTDQGYTTARAPNLDNLDATVSSRSDFDESADPVELLDTGGAAGTSAAELVADVAVYLETGGPNPHGTGGWDATAVVPAQTIRDAMKLAPSGGAPAAGSIDQHLDDLLTNVAAIPAGVWATVVSGNTDNTQAGGALNLIYQAAWNRQELDPTADRLNLYDRAGTVLIGYWPMTDADDNSLSKLLGAPARRGVFV